MSGTKRITVEERTWREVQQKAARLRDLQRELPGMLDAVRRAQAEQASRDAAEMKTRQDALAQSLAGLSQQAKRLEANTNRRIQAVTQTLLSEVRESAGQLRAETRQLMAEQDRRFSAELATERRERQQEFGALRGELADLRAGREQAAAAAATVVADAQRLRDAIASSLPHERFAPGRLAALERRLALAEGNVAQGRGEAALAQAQDLYLELGELRVDVELKNAEWLAARLTAFSAVTALTEQISYNTRLDVSEDGVPAELDVDFWSNGELTAIKAEADALAVRVQDEDNPPALADLWTIAEQDVTALNERLSAAVTKARTSQLASQLRVNLAEMVVGVLEETAGYRWDGEATYAGEDQRDAFYSKLRHLDDSEIVVEVSPDEDGKSCVLRILSFESDAHDDSERVTRAHAIADSLREQGLQTSEPSAEGDMPDKTLTDFEQLRRIKRAVPERG